jgi:hypothetical protein
VTLRAVPSLKELKPHPERAAELPLPTAAALLSACTEEIADLVKLRDTLRLRLASGFAPKGDDGDRLICAEQVGGMLGRSKSWVDHHLADLPPRKSLLGEPMWLSSDIEKWMKNLPPYGEERRG